MYTKMIGKYIFHVSLRESPIIRALVPKSRYQSKDGKKVFAVQDSDCYDRRVK